MKASGVVRTARRGNDDSRLELAQDAMSAEEIVEAGILSVRIQSAENIIQHYDVFLRVYSSCWADSLALTSTEHNTLASYRAEISLGKLSKVFLQGTSF